MKNSTLFALTLRWGLTVILLLVLIVPVEAGFRRLATGEIGFALEKRSPAYSLSAAPTRQWNTFMGGSGIDWGRGIALGPNDDVYVVGLSYTTWSSPTNAYAGGSDAFVVKLDSDGVRQWNTFLGSASGDDGNGIAMDDSGNVYIVGTSSASWGSPITPFAESNDAFVAKLNSDGMLQWLTFLGGSAADYGNDIALDASGNVYVVGTSSATWGTPINPYPGGYYAPFVAKLNDSGVLQWNTFWGAGGFADKGLGIAIDKDSNVYAVGTSGAGWGSPVNAYTDSTEACVVKLNTNGIRQWNTFLGSADSDDGQGIAVDGSGNVYVVGDSRATWGSPITSHGGDDNPDVFVARLNSSDGVRQWNTFTGSSNWDSGHGIGADGIGNVYVVGEIKDSSKTFSNAFLVKLGRDGFREWKTSIGYTYGNDTGSSVVPDKSGHVYLAGFSNDTWGSPIDAYTGSSDAFAAKFETATQPNLVIAKSADTDTTTPGGTVTYALAFSNQGYLTTTGVLITDTVPITLTNLSYIGSGAAITPTGSISYTWMVQDLAPGAGGVITVTGIVSPGLGTGTVLINTAIITCTETDSSLDNNSSSANVVIPAAQIFLPTVLRNQ
jgi:uncharacterized repeat protein (TIGR01451 family)